MRAEIKYLHSPDVNDLDSWEPADRANAGAFIQVMASPRGEPGEESFDLIVGTPAYLAEQGFADDEFVLSVDRWDFPLIRTLLTDAFEQPEAEDWDHLGELLGRIGHWEFADYVPFEPRSTPGSSDH